MLWEWLRVDGKKAAANSEIAGAMRVAEEAVVSNAHKAVWKHVEQESPNEFGGGNGHLLSFISVAIVLIAEGHAAVLEVQEAVI